MRKIFVRVQKDEEIDNSLYEQLMKDVRRSKKRNEKRIYIPDVVFERIDQMSFATRKHLSLNQRIGILFQNIFFR